MRILQVRILEWVALASSRVSSPTQGSNPGLPYCRRFLYHLSHQGCHAAAAKLLQSCPTLCDPIDRSPPGSPSLGFSRQEHWKGVAIAFSNACMHAKSLQSCLTPCDPIDGSPPGSPVPGILQAGILEWGAISIEASKSKIQEICIICPLGYN